MKRYDTILFEIILVPLNVFCPTQVRETYFTGLKKNTSIALSVSANLHSYTKGFYSVGHTYF